MTPYWIVSSSYGSRSIDLMHYCHTGLFVSLQALMYQDPERWGITLQTYIQLTMLDGHLSSIVSVLLTKNAPILL